MSLHLSQHVKIIFCFIRWNYVCSWMCIDKSSFLLHHCSLWPCRYLCYRIIMALRWWDWWQSPVTWWERPIARSCWATLQRAGPWCSSGWSTESPSWTAAQRTTSRPSSRCGGWFESKSVRSCFEKWLKLSVWFLQSSVSQHLCFCHTAFSLSTSYTTVCVCVCALVLLRHKRQEYRLMYCPSVTWPHTTEKNVLICLTPVSMK